MPLPKKWVVEYYTTVDGGCPIKDFIGGLPPKRERARLMAWIDLLEEKGIQLHRPYADYLRNEIYELRMRVSRIQYRVLYFFYQRNRIVLTHGFTKTTRKVPKIEIETARKYRDDWLERN
jgi:phage-related protein